MNARDYMIGEEILLLIGALIVSCVPILLFYGISVLIIAILFTVSYPFFIVGLVFHFKLINYIHIMQNEINKHKKDKTDE